jgi:hypothetical protein
MNSDNGALRAYGWIWIGIPSVLGWIAYGLAWLLAPRIAEAVDPLVWAGNTVLVWYLFCAFIAFFAMR